MSKREGGWKVTARSCEGKESCTDADNESEGEQSWLTEVRERKMTKNWERSRGMVERTMAREHNGCEKQSQKSGVSEGGREGFPKGKL